MDALSTAHAATDKALDAMEKYVRSIYLRSVREIYKSWQKFFEQERKEIDKLQEDYEKAKKSGDKTLTKKAGIALTREKKKETVQSKWFHNAVKQTAENLLHVNETAVEYLNGRLPETYVTNFNAVGELCESAITGYSYHIVDENTVRELAMSDTSLLPYKEIDPAKDIAWNVRQMKSEVLQGILQGEDMQAIASRLSNVIGMNENSAVRNARTMVTSAENKGRQDGFYQAEEDGIILEKYWLCVHGERTREAHAAAGNDYSKSKSIPQSQPFIVGGEKLMFPGDKGMGASGWNLYNCRCSVAAVVKGFKKAQVQTATAEKQVEEQRATSFTPAKTTAEAEAYAREHIFSGDFLGKTSYKGIDVDMANGINETLERITQKYGRKLSGIEVVNPKTAKGLKALGGSADAPFATNPLTGMVYVNKDVVKNAKALKAYTDKGDEAFKLVMANKDKLSGDMRSLAEVYEKAGKDLVDNSLEGMITHEYGHYLSTAINPKADVVSKITDGMGDHLISGYSQHNVREYLAESFTEYERGDRSKLDPAVIELFEGAIKR